MAQLDNRFIAFWMDTTTAPWTPLTGLSATITIREADTPYTIVVNNEAMTEMGWGHYIYVFSGMSIAKEYSYTCNPNATAFIESGVTQNTLYKWIEDNRGGGGGGYSVNLSGVTGSISNLGKLVKDENEKLKKFITKENNETNSHIEVAKDTIITTIEDIETNVDLTAVTEWIGVLKSRFTKLSEWLKTEQKKEMESKDTENKGKLSELQSKIDEMEEVFEEMQNLSKSEIDEKQKLIDDMEETAKEIMEELEKEKVVNKEATEKEIKDKLISSLSE